MYVYFLTRAFGWIANEASANFSVEKWRGWSEEWNVDELSSIDLFMVGRVDLVNFLSLTVGWNLTIRGALRTFDFFF